MHLGSESMLDKRWANIAPSRRTRFPLLSKAGANALLVTADESGKNSP